MADEIWDALYMHVERHREMLDAGDGSGLMDKEPQPDFSMPEENGFDDAVANETYAAQEEVVEEVLDEERRESRVVDSRNMYGRKERA